MFEPLTETLQAICLQCITNNYDRFHLAFNSATFEHLRSCVKGMQKLYSYRILGMLADRNKLKNEHLKLLINEYTRQINLQYLIGCDFSAIEERLQEIGSVVTTFSATGIEKFYFSDRFIQHLSQIQVLELANTNSSDHSLAIIAENCCALKCLDLYGCEKVTDKGLTFLCQREPPLESLNVEFTSVSYRAVALILKNIPSLTKLQFDNMPRAIFEAKGLNDALGISNDIIFNLSNLVILNNPLRPENHLTAILNVCTESCPKTKDLIVSEIITEEQLHLVSTFENLETAHLQCSMMVTPKLCANNFLGIRGDKLRILSVTSFSISIEVLANCCPNLECLTLQYPSFQEVKCADISFPCLKMLSLQNVSFDLDASQISSSCIISSSPNLMELHVVYCQFLDTLQDAILNCPKKLVMLNFSNTPVNTDFIEEIVRIHTGLIKIVLDNSGITSNDYDDLMDLVDDMERKVHISWADYSEAIRELFYHDDFSYNYGRKRFILKL